MSENRSRIPTRAPASSIPRGTVGAKTPSPLKTTAPAARPGAPVGGYNGTSIPQYEVSGPGLELCMPNKPTSFVVASVGNKRALKAADLKVTVKGSAVAKHSVKERGDGSLEVVYQAPMSGEYKITLAVGPTAIPGSPFRVLCQLPRACEINSEIDLKGSKTTGFGFVGELYTAHLLCKDQYGQPYAGKVDVSADVMDGPNVLGEAEVVEVAPGEFDISFVPEISSTYGLSVVLDGSRPLANSPFEVRVKSDETVPSKCKLFGAGLTQGTAGEPLKFSVQAVDGKGNARLVGGDPFEVEIAGPPGAKPRVEVKDNMNGTYDVKWQTDVSGVYLVKVLLEEAIVGSGPVSCQVAPTTVKASLCTCTGLGLKKAQAGTPAEFKIVAHDKLGNIRTTGGDAFQVHIHRAGSSGKGAPVQGIVDDGGDGTYRARFTLNVAGQYDVHVTSAETGEAVKGSPFLCAVEPGQIDPKSSRVYGPGLSAVQLGRQSQVLVELADKWGNKVYASPDFDASIIQIDVRGPGAVVVAPGPLQDGVQTYTYIAKQPGSYVISATVDGQHLCDSPATVTASTSEACAELCEVRGTPLELNTVAGDTADFVIVAKDAKSIQKSLGGDVFKATWKRAGSGAAEDVVTTGKVEDHGTGEYSARFFATAAGSYAVSVTHKGVNIAGSPFTAHVSPAPIEPSACVASGEGMSKAAAGVKATFTIKPRDKFGNPVPVDNLNHFNVVISGPQKPEVVLSYAGEDRSELVAAYTPTLAGAYTVAAAYKGLNIQGSTWQLAVSPSSGKAVHSRFLQLPDSFTAGKPGRVSLQVYDVHGNETVGGDHVVVEVDSVAEGTSSLEIADEGKGVYSASFTPTKSGFVTLRTFVNGELLDQPRTLPVHPAGINALLPLTPGPWQCTAGDRTAFLVRGKDEFGNLVTQGGAVLQAKVLVTPAGGKPDEIAANVQDEGDGTYSVTCLVQQACDFKVVAALANNPSISTSVSGSCAPGAVCPAKCQLLQQDAQVGAGEEGVLHLVRCDKYGNHLGESSGPLPISATSTGPEHMDVRVLEQTDGTVKIHYAARKVGNYKLSVTSSANGEAFAGSPWEVTVMPARVLPENCVAKLVTATSQRQVVAGQAVGVRLAFKDKHGNLVPDSGSHEVSIKATGPEEVIFTKSAKETDTYSAKLTSCGSYLVYASIGDVTLTGWPQVVHVLADASDPAKCYVSGEPTNGLRVGEACTLLLHTMDTYGNPRGRGGEEVVVELVGPEGSSVTKAWVVDNENGTYSARFKVDRPGKWLVRPRVCRRYVGGDGYEMLAATGTLTAMEYTLKGLPEGPVEAGNTASIVVTTEVSGAMVTGSEVFTAILAGPSGAQQHLPMQVLEDKSGYKLDVPLIAAGQHSLSVIMDGADVLGSPAHFTAVPSGVHLPNCLISGGGLQACSAGVAANFTIVSRDCNGNPLPKGGAKFVVKILDRDSAPAEGTLRDNKDGSYDASFIITKAGSYSIQLGVAGGKGYVTYRGTCHPGKVVAGPCVVVDKPPKVTAGGFGEMRVMLKDKYGNTVTNTTGPVPITAEASDSSLQVSTHEAGDGHLVVRYTSKVAGQHPLVLLDPTNREFLPGSPFTVDVAPAAVDPRKCVANIPRDGATARCGDAVVVTADLKDTFGNIVRKPKSGGILDVRGTGPSELVFEPAKAAGNLSAIPTSAGLYTLYATVDGQMLKGWPKAITVQPAGGTSVRCALYGEALNSGFTCGTPQTLTIVVSDEFGNRRHSNKDHVELAVVGPDDKQATVSAKDVGAGTFVAELLVKAAGIYKLVPRVNSHIAREAAKEVVASWPAITGADCVLREPTAGRSLLAGEEFVFTIAAKQSKGGRTLSGNEVVAATLSTPAGKTVVLPATHNSEAGTYGLSFKPVQAGAYTLAVSVAGAPLPGGPMQLEAAPGRVFLPACMVTGTGAHRCVAGQAAAFTLQAVDVHGNEIKEGGASIKATITPEAGKGPIAATVADNADGTYKVSYGITQAGPFSLDVSLDGSSATLKLEGECVPGPAVGKACQVEKADEALVAGEPGAIRVARFDKYGNRVTSGEGQPPVTAEVLSDGSRSLSLWVADQGDGSAVVSYHPTTAGTYTIKLAVGEGPDTALPTTCVLAVAPAAVSVPQCKATLEGVSASSAIPAGAPLAVSVSLHDAFSNALLPTLSADDAKVDVEIISPVTQPFDQDSRGAYTAQLTKAGTYLLAAKVQGRMLTGWPKLIHVEPGPAAAAACSVAGPALDRGVVCGQPARLVLQAKDAFGNNRTAGGDKVEFKATGASVNVAEKGEVVDNGDGTYRLETIVPFSGQWALFPTVDGVPVRPDGFVVSAVHGPLTPDEMELAGPSRKELICGTKDMLAVKPKQAGDGRKVSGKEHVTAYLTSPSGTRTPLPVVLLQGCEGYQVEAAWRETGAHQLAVFLDGEHIVGSPLALTALPGPLAPAACTVAEYRNEGGVVELTVTGRDQLNNPCGLAAGQVSLRGVPASCLGDVDASPSDDGRSVRLHAAVKERGAFNVLVGGRPLFVSDRQLQWSGPRDIAAKVLRPLLDSDVSAVAGEQTAVLVTLSNATGLPEVVATLTDAQGKAVSPAPLVKARDDGLYEVLLSAQQAGTYALSAAVKEEPEISCSMDVAIAPGPVSPANCIVDAPASPLRCAAGDAAKLTLRRADKFGNLVADSACGFRATAAGPGPAVVEAQEIGPGLTQYSVKARTAGRYRLTLASQAAGEAVAGSPFEVDVEAGPVSGSSSSFMVSGFTGKAASTVTAGQEAELVVDTRDRFGNVTAAAPAAVRATAHGPQGIVEFKFKEEANGVQSTLAAIITVAGKYHLDVQLLDPATNQWHKVAADETRATLFVRPAAVSNAHTTFSELPATAMAGIPAELYVQPTDKYGNKGATGASFLVQLYDGKEAIACPVTRSAEEGAPVVAKVVAQRTGNFKVRVIVAKGDQKELLHTADIKVVEATTSADKTYILGHWPPSGPVANIPAGFVVQACDKYGNNLTKGGARFVVDIMGLPSQAISITDRGDGQYNVQYTVPSEGSYRVNVTLEGHHIQGSPTSLTAFRDVVAMANMELERRMASTVTHLRRGVTEARALHKTLKAEAASLEQFIPVMVEGTRNGIYEALKQQDALLAETRAAYQREALERRRLHNLVQELRGNIRVYVRVKPLTQEEESSGMFSVLKCTDDHSISCTAQGAPKTFNFDRTFGPISQQEEVFEDVAQLVTSALDGYNVCIFAYGQTGAGKTYTMEGTSDNPGINYRTMRELFRCINEEHTADYSHEITASIVEIYNEVVNDLLTEGGKREVELQKTASGFDVADITEIEVTSPEQIFEIMARGYENRATGSHDVNAHSSRSHALLIINVRVSNNATGIVTKGKLTLCDLAGSERINKTHATGLTLTEAQNINRSLLELGNVISALMQQAPHIPYRNSKLTMLLQDSLGGDAKALMFCNVSPASVHVSESLSSLAFASKVSNVVLKTPQKKFEEQPQQASGISAQQKARLLGAGTKGKRTMSSIPTLGGGGNTPTHRDRE